MKAEYLQFADRYEFLNKSITDSIDGIICSEDDAVFRKLEKFRSGAPDSLEISEILKAQIEQDEYNASVLADKIKAIDDAIIEITKCLAEADNIKKIKESLEQSKKKLQDDETEAAILETRLNEVRVKYSELQEIERKINDIDSELSDYDMLVKNQMELAKVLSEIELSAKDKSEKQAVLFSFADWLEKSETELKKLEHSGENIFTLNYEIEKSRE